MLEAVPRGALRDPMTGLATGEALADRVPQAQACVRRGGGVVGLVSMEVPQVGLALDAGGRRLAGQITRRAADRLRRAARGSDTVARVTGGSFAVLSSSVRGADELALATRRLSSAVEGPAHLDGRTVELCCVSRWLVLEPDEPVDRFLHLLHSGPDGLVAGAASTGGPVPVPRPRA